LTVPARDGQRLRGASSWKGSYFAIWLNDNPVGLVDARDTIFVESLKNIDI
jgi:hypothetical protein